jgi:hypothetical protein
VDSQIVVDRLYVADMPSVDIEHIKNKLEAHNVSYVTKREVPGQAGQTAVFFFCRTVTNASFMVELKFKAGMNICKVSVRSPNKAMSDLVKTTISRLIQ